MGDALGIRQLAPSFAAMLYDWVMRKWQRPVGGAALAVMATWGLLLALPREPSATVYVNSEHGIRLEYPKSLSPQNTSEEKDKKNNRLLRLNREDPPTRVIVWYEDGLQAATTLTRQQPLDRILEALPKAYPRQFPEFKLLEERRVKVGDKDGAEVVFTYKGPAKEAVRERLLIVIKDADRAVYVAVHVPENNHDALSKEVDSLFASVSVN